MSLIIGPELEFKWSGFGCRYPSSSIAWIYIPLSTYSFKDHTLSHQNPPFEQLFLNPFKCRFQSIGSFQCQSFPCDQEKTNQKISWHLHRTCPVCNRKWPQIVFSLLPFFNSFFQLSFLSGFFLFYLFNPLFCFPFFIEIINKRWIIGIIHCSGNSIN